MLKIQNTVKKKVNQIKYLHQKESNRKMQIKKMLKNNN